MELNEIIAIIDEMMVNPPMRGDIALSDLRNLLLEKQEQKRLYNLANKSYAEAWARSVENNV
jgi:hypothetical protein